MATYKLMRGTAREFTSIVKGENFMTPRVHGYYLKGDYIIELSSGDFMSGRMYGVTVANRVTKTHENALCRSFDKLKDANAYMKGL